MHVLPHSVPPTMQQSTTNPRLHQRLLDTQGKSESVSCRVTSPFFWVLVHTRVPSKSLFLQSCVSSGVSVVGLMATSSKRAYGIPWSAVPRGPDPVADHHQLMPPPETPGHLQASLGQSLVGLLFLSTESWRTRGSICALQETISQSCVSSGGSMVGLTVTTSKRAYAIPRSAAPRAPAPAAGHC